MGYIVGVDFSQIGLDSSQASLELKHLSWSWSRNIGLAFISYRYLLLNDLCLHIPQLPLHFLTPLHLPHKLPLECRHIWIQVNKLSQTQLPQLSHTIVSSLWWKVQLASRHQLGLEESPHL